MAVNNNFPACHHIMLTEWWAALSKIVRIGRRGIKSREGIRMSPETKNKLSIGIVTSIFAVAGAVGGAGVVWGTQVTRVATLEKQVDVLFNMSMSLVRIEQATHDIQRRLDRLERH